MDNILKTVDPSIIQEIGKIEKDVDELINGDEDSEVMKKKLLELRHRQLMQGLKMNSGLIRAYHQPIL